MSTLDELTEQFERQEQRVMQLVKIIAATNKRLADLTLTMEELRNEQTL